MEERRREWEREGKSEGRGEEKERVKKEVRGRQEEGGGKRRRIGLG